MDVHENAWDALCDYHNGRNQQLLLAKIQRMQKIGDLLVDIADAMLFDFPSRDDIRQLIADWNKEKEQQ